MQQQPQQNNGSDAGHNSSSSMFPPAIPPPLPSYNQHYAVGLGHGHENAASGAGQHLPLPPPHQEEEHVAVHWLCDICKRSAFDTREAALAHEAVCSGSGPGTDAGGTIAGAAGVQENPQEDGFEAAAAGGGGGTADNDAGAVEANHALEAGPRSIDGGGDDAGSSGGGGGARDVQHSADALINAQQKWMCDVCKVAVFDSMDEACRHEESCEGPAAAVAEVVAAVVATTRSNGVTSSIPSASGGGGGGGGPSPPENDHQEKQQQQFQHLTQRQQQHHHHHQQQQGESGKVQGAAITPILVQENGEHNAMNNQRLDREVCAKDIVPGKAEDGPVTANIPRTDDIIHTPSSATAGNDDGDSIVVVGNTSTIDKAKRSGPLSLAAATDERKAGVDAVTGADIYVWTCDVCNFASFATHEQACLHEATCKGPSPLAAGAASSAASNERIGADKCSEASVKDTVQEQKEHSGVAAANERAGSDKSSEPSSVKDAVREQQGRKKPEIEQIAISHRQVDADASTPVATAAKKEKRKRDETETKWLCAFCKVAVFDSESEAFKHEERCGLEPDLANTKQSTSDVDMDDDEGAVASDVNVSQSKEGGKNKARQEQPGGPSIARSNLGPSPYWTIAQPLERKARGKSRSLIACFVRSNSTKAIETSSARMEKEIDNTVNGFIAPVTGSRRRARGSAGIKGVVHYSLTDGGLDSDSFFATATDLSFVSASTGTRKKSSKRKKAASTRHDSTQCSVWSLEADARLAKRKRRHTNPSAQSGAVYRCEKCSDGPFQTLELCITHEANCGVSVSFDMFGESEEMHASTERGTARAELNLTELEQKSQEAAKVAADAEGQSRLALQERSDLAENLSRAEEEHARALHVLQSFKEKASIHFNEDGTLRPMSEVNQQKLLDAQAMNRRKVEHANALVNEIKAKIKKVELVDAICKKSATHAVKVAQAAENALEEATNKAQIEEDEDPMAKEEVGKASVDNEEDIISKEATCTGAHSAATAATVGASNEDDGGDAEVGGNSDEEYIWDCEVCNAPFKSKDLAMAHEATCAGASPAASNPGKDNVAAAGSTVVSPNIPSGQSLETEREAEAVANISVIANEKVKADVVVDTGKVVAMVDVAQEADVVGSPPVPYKDPETDADTKNGEYDVNVDESAGTGNAADVVEHANIEDVAIKQSNACEMEQQKKEHKRLLQAARLQRWRDREKERASACAKESSKGLDISPPDKSACAKEADKDLSTPNARNGSRDGPSAVDNTCPVIVRADEQRAAAYASTTEQKQQAMGNVPSSASVEPVKETKVVGVQTTSATDRNPSLGNVNVSSQQQANKTADVKAARLQRWRDREKEPASACAKEADKDLSSPDARNSGRDGPSIVNTTVRADEQRAAAYHEVSTAMVKQKQNETSDKKTDHFPSSASVEPVKESIVVGVQPTSATDQGPALGNVSVPSQQQANSIKDGKAAARSKFETTGDNIHMQRQQVASGARHTTKEKAAAEETANETEAKNIAKVDAAARKGATEETAAKIGAAADEEVKRIVVKSAATVKGAEEASAKSAAEETHAAENEAAKAKADRIAEERAATERAATVDAKRTVEEKTATEEANAEAKAKLIADVKTATERAATERAKRIAAEEAKKQRSEQVEDNNATKQAQVEAEKPVAAEKVAKLPLLAVEKKRDPAERNGGGDDTKAPNNRGKEFGTMPQGAATHVEKREGFVDGTTTVVSTADVAKMRRRRRSFDPNSLPSGVAELGKRPVAVPNPELPSISKNRRRPSHAKAEVGKDYAVSTAEVANTGRRRSRDPNSLPSGVAELGKRPVAVPNPELPTISKKRRWPSRAKAEVGKDPVVSTADVAKMRRRRSRDPNSLPSGVSELGKRPVAVPNPELPTISRKRRKPSRTKTEVGKKSVSLGVEGGGSACVNSTVETRPCITTQERAEENVAEQSLSGNRTTEVNPSPSVAEASTGNPVVTG